MPCTTTSKGREAVIFGSFWRNEPAAAFRGFANLGFPASSNESFNSSNDCSGKIPHRELQEGREDFYPLTQEEQI